MEVNSLPTILIADDHHLLNDALSQLFNAHDVPFQIAGQVFNGMDVITAVEKLRPNIILLDINMPGRNGLDIARQLVFEYSTLRVVLLTMYGSNKFVETAREIGLAGYMLKNILKENLIDGLQAVMRGETYFDPNLDHLIAHQHKDDDFLKQFNLTKRECEIIPLLCQGMTNAQIGNQLYLGELTVKTHRKNIYYKLGISHLAALIQFARTHNLY